MNRNTQSNCEYPKGIVETLLYLLRLATGKFDGTITIGFEAGNISHLVEHRNLKADPLPTTDHLRSNYDQQ